MKVIKFTLLAGALLGAAGVAAAQPEQPRRGPAAEVTRDQALARATERFGRMDANRDGRVTRDELREVRQARVERRQERRAERQGQRFERLDTNRDGQISREEFSQRAQARGERGNGRRGMRGMRGPRGGQFAMRGLGRMLGEDGVMTIEEFRQHALQRFERLDSNRDGRITAEERRTMRRQFRGNRLRPTSPSPQN